MTYIQLAVDTVDGDEMTKAEFNDTIDALVATRAQATSSKAAALAYLKKAGIVDQNGELKKELQQAEAA